MIKILIIEDEPLVARMYEKTLLAEGFKVIVAGGGKDGISKVKTQKPNLVICDVMMPEPNGMEVLEIIKKDPETKNLPVIMLTNLSSSYDAKLAISKGASSYWVKKDNPPQGLAEKIKQVLERIKTTTAKPEPQVTIEQAKPVEKS